MYERVREETSIFLDRITSIELIFNGFKCGWKWFQSGEKLPVVREKKVLAKKEKRKRRIVPFNYRLVICTGVCMEAKAATVSSAEQNQNPICCLTLSEILAAAAPSPTVTGTEVRFGEQEQEQQQQQNQTRTGCFNRTKFGQCCRPLRTT